MQNDASLSALYGALEPSVKGRLKNKAYDLATADTDTVSIQDPLSPYKGDTLEMSPLQWMSTFNSQFKQQNPEYAALNAYYNPHQGNRSLGYVLGDNINSLYQGVGSTIGRTLDKGPLAGGLMAMAPGLLIGALGTGALNMLTGQRGSKDMLRNALLAGLATGSLGAYSGYLRKNKPQWEAAAAPTLSTPQDINLLQQIAKQKAMQSFAKQGGIKRAYASASEAQSKILQLIQSAPGLSFNERSQLTAGVAQLASNDLSQLASALTGVGGAAVGAIVARFLLNKGLIGTVLGAIFGGRVAQTIFGAATPRNDLGQASLQGRSLTGHFL